MWPGSRHSCASTVFPGSISATAAPQQQRHTVRRTWSIAPRTGSWSFINPACSGAGKPQGPSRYPEPGFIWQEAGEHKHTGLSNWIPSDLYSIWDDNEVVNTEIQDSNKPLTFIDLSVNLNHHLVSRRWVIYCSLSRLAPPWESSSTREPASTEADKSCLPGQEQCPWDGIR